MEQGKRPGLALDIVGMRTTTDLVCWELLSCKSKIPVAPEELSHPHGIDLLEYYGWRSLSKCERFAVAMEKP